MNATRDERTALRSLITVHRHAAAVAAERLALSSEDDGPCTANDLAHELHQLEILRLNAAKALAVEQLERQFAA